MINSSRRVLVISENIFSDRLFNSLGLKNSNAPEFIFLSSKELAKLEENFEQEVKSNFHLKSRLKIFKFFKSLFKYVAPSGKDLSSVSNTFQVESYNWNFLKKYIFKYLIYLLSRYQYLRKFSRKLIISLLNLESRYIPELDNFDGVFTFSVGNLKSNLVSIVALRALNKNLKVFSYIQSWDNPTTKGFPIFQPDFVYIWSDSMKEDVINNYEFCPNKMLIVGSPLFKKIEFSKTQNTIMLALKSSKAYKDNVRIVNDLIEIRDQIKFDLYIRIHPLNLGNNSFQEMQELKYLAKKHNFQILLPNENKNDILLTEEYDQISRDTFLKSSIFISIFSTMNIESIFYDIPTINISYDYREDGHSQRQDIRIDANQIHNKRSLSFGSIMDAKNKKELGKYINQILTNDSEITNKSQFISYHCGPNYEFHRLKNHIRNFLNL